MVAQAFKKNSERSGDKDCRETQQKPAAEQGKMGTKRTEEEVLRADLRRQVPW